LAHARIALARGAPLWAPLPRASLLSNRSSRRAQRRDRLGHPLRPRALHRPPQREDADAPLASPALLRGAIDARSRAAARRAIESDRVAKRLIAAGKRKARLAGEFLSVSRNRSTVARIDRDVLLDGAVLAHERVGVPEVHRRADVARDEPYWVADPECGLSGDYAMGHGRCSRCYLCATLLTVAP